jgi:hopanoid biosynthesis associated protein HpnK
LRRLIVTADDFGAAPEVNEAVEAAHREGVLTAASLMVAGAAVKDAVMRAHRLPSLRVGLHLTLVEGRPVLPAAEVHHLIGPEGRFRSDMARLGAEIAFDRRVRQQTVAEITAQFEAFRATGLALDHCNAHKHFHLHPVLGGLVASIGSRFGLTAARVPIEPHHVLRRVDPRAGWRPSWLTGSLAHALRRRLRSKGILTPERSFGTRWSGRMTQRRLAGLIRHLPEGISEIYLHPATRSYETGAAGYHYREELDALLAPDTLAACRSAAVRLGGFSDFLAPEDPEVVAAAPLALPERTVP